jgi:hypothetical protein
MLFPLAVFFIKPLVKMHFHWRLLNKTAIENSISTGGSRITASGNDDFHWPLALAALKSASENVSRTATIEAVCTSDNNKLNLLKNSG